VTTVLPSPSCFATSIAAHTAVPPEPPMSRPSSRAIRLAVRNESLSDTVTHWSTIERSNVCGQKSSPTPSTRYGCICSSPEV
jgi:hypothetical protein